MTAGPLPPLVKAKLSPPKVSDACLRDETLEALAGDLRRRVTLVCAPAGYGKTTVALEAIRRLGLRTVWYKLDVLDQDPVVLIASLVEALARLHSGFGQTIRDRLANAHEVAYPVEQMAAEFVTEVAEEITGGLHIVLDDYHEAADSPALNATLDYLVANLPSDVRFIVLTRYEPAFGIAKLKLEDELGVVGVDQLRFGPSEVLEVVRRRTGIDLTLERAEGLADLTEGWPASVVLAAMAVRLVGVDALESALADPRLRQDVFSYLAEQVYARETPEVRAFLRRTCCLEHVSVDLATRVGAPRRAHRILAHLQANGVFTFATDQEGTYRYHGLFREFLRQKSIQEDGPARSMRLSSRRPRPSRPPETSRRPSTSASSPTNRGSPWTSSREPARRTLTPSAPTRSSPGSIACPRTSSATSLGPDWSSGRCTCARDASMRRCVTRPTRPVASSWAPTAAGRITRSRPRSGRCTGRARSRRQWRHAAEPSPWPTSGSSGCTR